jgi:hypothetical protein
MQLRHRKFPRRFAITPRSAHAGAFEFNFPNGPANGVPYAKCYVVSCAADRQAKVFEVDVMAIYKVGLNGLGYANAPYLPVRAD